jgi:uncharacterized glyoxalase superfamily protein PhnB
MAVMAVRRPASGLAFITYITAITYITYITWPHPILPRSGCLTIDQSTHRAVSDSAGLIRPCSRPSALVGGGTTKSLRETTMNTAVKDHTQSSPQVLGGLIPYLEMDGASAAAAFYQAAFGAVEVARHPVDDKGRTMHIHLHINGSSLMLSDGYPEHGHPAQKPQGFNLTLQLKDIDTWWNRAVAAGATVVMPVQQMFWGDRYGQLRDPFGVNWSLNQPSR